ncbi:MAG: single-stranded-DNA-specific exonuclease RecJ [Hyphomicrobiaceae bacterium]|nr:single-stranded-DNA-specific exonuclease RecJ [Hyphomicrobiaceae bacterium]
MPVRLKSVDSQDGALLGVRNSVRGYTWRERLERGRLPQAHAISQRHGLPDLLGRMLAARGVAIDEVGVFLEPTIKALMPDPSALRDADKAAARIAQAISTGEAIAIFGDYDVDGACSSALLARFLRHHGITARIYIPDRLSEGYGPNPAAMRLLAGEGARLIVTVDCGTTSFGPLAAAREAGADVIVIDHHQADEALPAVSALVNPNRQDDVSGQGHLCAAGVVFLVLVAVTRELRRLGYYGEAVREPALLDELDLVALATVCDVVPLEGLNRAYVVKGLQVMRGRRNVGLKALFDAAGLDTAPTPYHLGYILGPRINAGGRIGDAGLGARLLTLTDRIEAGRIAETLDRLNRERKSIETAALDEAMAAAEQRIAADPGLPIILVGAEQWHKGIVGLVASRLTERFHRPTCVISWTREAASGRIEGTGSLRSVKGVDIGGAVRKAVAAGLLIKGGGHAMAAGLTLAEDRQVDVEAFLARELAASAGAAIATAALEIDGALTPGAVTTDLLTLMDRAGPFGQGNPQPRFVFPAHRVRFAKIVGESHVRLTLEAGDGSKLDAVAFRAAGQPLGDLLLAAVGGFPVHVCGNLKRDTWGGREKLELMVEDAADPRACG